MNAINLPNFAVINTQEAEDLKISVEYTLFPTTCEKCKSRSATFKRHDSREHWYIDFPIRGKRVKLCVKHRRFRCSECGAVFFEALPDIDVKRDMTVMPSATSAHGLANVLLTDQRNLMSSTAEWIFPHS